MNFFYVKENILILTFLAPVITGAFRFKHFDKSTLVFYSLAVAAFITESLAYYSAIRYRDNLLVYNISNIIQLFLACLYFNAAIPGFRKKNIGFFLGLLGIAVGVVNNFFIQSIHRITSYFLFFQALVTITLSIIALWAFMDAGDRHDIRKDVHFWIPVILIFFWSFSYLLFSVLSFYAARTRPAPLGVIIAVTLVNIITNLAITGLFFVYPKMKSHVR